MNEDRRISEEGVAALKLEEGLRLVAYQCSANKWTIGWGSTMTAAGPVKQGMRITESEAENMLRSDVRMFEQHMRDLITVPMTQAMWDATVSFVYNVGEDAFSKSTFLKQLNAGRYEDAASELLRWTKVRKDGEYVDEPGLINRRTRERNRFLSQTPVPTATVPSPSPPRDAPPGSAPKPTEEPSMPLPVVLIGSLLQAAATAIPEVAKILFDKDKPTRVRNVEAGAVVLGKIAEATRPAATPPEAWNEQRGVEAVLASPAAAAAARAAILDDIDRIMGIVARGEGLDEASRDRAAERAKSDDAINEATKLLIHGALGGAATVFVSLVVLLILQTIYMPDHRPMGELVALFITTCGTIIGFAVAIYLYRFGSSAGSKASGDAIRAIAETKK